MLHPDMLLKSVCVCERERERESVCVTIYLHSTYLFRVGLYNELPFAIIPTF